MSARLPEATPLRNLRQAPPVPVSLRRANVLAQLDLARSRSRPDPMGDIERRMERIEAAIYALAAEVARWRPS